MVVNHEPSRHGAENGDARPNGSSISPEQPAPIAIIGMACRFAGDVDSPSKLWKLCAEGRDVWSPVPTDRFDIKSWFHPDTEKEGRVHALGGYFLGQDVSLFDAGFFNVPTDLANAMDPQMRYLLESTYEAMEDAGIPAEKLVGSDTSVFMATFTKDYHELQIKDSETLQRNFIGGVGTATLSNRVSYFFDLQGPSMTIDTGCSGGLVALHQACQSIRLGESEVSIVGGVNIMLHQDPFIYIGAAGTLGINGRCFAWDSRAEGYGRGEGVATLVLKPLAAAVRDNDRIHAVIRESALNQDGKTQTLWSPSADAQTKLIQDCYKRAGLDISETGYVEAHMTGTTAGDPVEAESLARTFGMSREPNDPVLVGSVKTVIGHTEAASGLAAIIKTVFALKELTIAPNLNYETPSPQIPLDEWKLQVPRKLTRWPMGKKHRASVNNFGYGGANAHVILERTPISMLGEHSNESDSYDASASLVYVVSAKASAPAKDMASQLAAHIRQCANNGQHMRPADLAYTLAERRSLFDWRFAFRATSLDELCSRLESTAQAVHSTKKPRLGFVFSGQGAQWHAMARELLEAYPKFNQDTRKADKILKELGADWSLCEELVRDKTSTRVDDVRLSQPISVAIQLCLVDLLASWNVSPTAVTSHSSGEIAAAYAVGALSFRDALGVAYFRGELAAKHQQFSPSSGGMLAVGLGPKEILPWITSKLAGRIVAACINSPNSVTLSGDLDAIEEVASQFAEAGVFHRKLKVPMAYHSNHMLPMAQDYTDCLQSILPVERGWKNILFYSPTTGGLVTSPETLSPAHWTQNLTSPVQFSQAFDSMVFGPNGPQVDIVIEIGPHSTLAGPIRDIVKARGAELPYKPCLQRHVDSVETMQDLACEILAWGYPVDLPWVNATRGAAENPSFVPDLPSYPWNHTTRYWMEPRTGKEQRLKTFPPRELLGSPLAGSNGSAPVWRNFLRLSGMDWLAEHRVGSNVVLPGAAYISMAIEAVRLLTDSSEETIHGYRLRDVDILNAMVVPETAEGIETQLSLRQCGDKDLESVGWFQFEVCSLGTGDAWVEHCRGFVSVETIDQSKGGPTTYLPTPPCVESYLGTPDASPALDTAVSDIYASLREMGINHGPRFQNLIESRAAQGRSITSFAIANCMSSEDHDYVLHPTTLDSMLQATYGTLPKNRARDAIFLPRSIRTMFIPRHFSRRDGDKLRAFTELVQTTRRGYASDIAVLHYDEKPDSSEFFQIRGFFAQAVPLDSEVSSTEQSGLCSRFRWEPDVLHDIPLALRAAMQATLEEEQGRVERDSVRASYYFIEAAVRELSSQDPSSWSPHHRKFYKWMKSVVERTGDAKLPPGSQMWAKATRGMRQMLFDELSTNDGACQLLVRLGEQLPAIVRGDVAPLDLMMEDNLLAKYYEDLGVSKRSLQHFSGIVKLFAAKNPGAKVIEVGAGTGAATKQVLEAFGATAREAELPGTLLSQYTFTDISSGFFAAAQQKLAAWEGLVEFKPLDIERDPTEQSIPEGHYDLVVASMVLHATQNLRNTLRNVRKLLKPGGKVLLVETTQDRLDMQLVFGTLPGWWLGEQDGRETSPNVPAQAWDEALRAVGFSGIDVEMRDCDDEQIQMCSVLFSTAASISTIHGPISVVCRTDENGAAQQAWMSQLCEKINAEWGIMPTIQSLDDVQGRADGTICILVLEMSRPFVSDMDEESFEKLRSLLIHCRDALWVGCGGLIDGVDPSYAATLGLLRTLRMEDPGKKYVHLDLERPAVDDGNTWTGDKLELVTHVLRQGFDGSTEVGTTEREYSVKGSVIHVARAYPDKPMDRICNDRQAEPAAELQPFHQPDRPLIWELSTSGLLSDLHFVDALALSSGNLPSGVVEVEAKAFGLNFRDVMDALNLLDGTFVSHEIAGIVTGLGPDTEESGLKIGDKVCGIGKGLFSSISHASWQFLTKIPDGMSYEVAASIPAIYVTAYYSLITVARLQKGESVLIHAATGGVGQAAIVLAQRAGAEIFATCSTQAKRDFLIQQYGIAPDHILASRDASFAPAIMKMTNGKGVDVVLNSLSGPLLKASWDCVARFGRFIEIGKIDISAGRRLDMTPFTRCAMYACVDILQLVEHDGAATQEALTESVRICHGLQASPVSPITIYPISEMEKAMRHMQSGVHMGKLVMVPGDGDLVKVISRPAPFSLDDPTASYLIIGGVTGIGRAVAEWMIEKGARNLILVSRNATLRPAAAEITSLGERQNCNVRIYDCDVSNESSLTKLLEECRRSMPPIRGLVNGAMVLQARLHLADAVLEGMSFQKWQGALRPRIQGSRNLHKHLPDLSFFIVLSSITGVIGNPSQANYGASSAFLDALARHRTSKGQPAIVLDLGVVLSAGYVKDKEESGDHSMRTRSEKRGLVSIDVSQVLRLVEAAIRNPLPATLDESQVVVSVNDHTTEIWSRDGLLQDPRFNTLTVARGRGGGLANGALVGAGSSSTAAVLVSALSNPSISVPEAISALADALVSKLAEMFNLPASDIDAALPMSCYGVDSLVAVELRKWLSSVARAKVSVFDILQSPSLSDFATLLAGKSEYTVSKIATA
ncbi:hypothetical protein GQ53DRAFT_862683 [Thozetella sp. PMI_491]|nr:hypothetical protein GQ53DRAFT_862683 [Thozetella sp. PMI_491]